MAAFREVTSTISQEQRLEHGFLAHSWPHAFASTGDMRNWIEVWKWMVINFSEDFRKPSQRSYHPCWDQVGRDWHVIIYFRDENHAFAFKMRWC